MSRSFSAQELADVRSAFAMSANRAQSRTAAIQLIQEQVHFQVGFLDKQKKKEDPKLSLSMWFMIIPTTATRVDFMYTLS